VVGTIAALQTWNRPATVDSEPPKRARRDDGERVDETTVKCCLASLQVGEPTQLASMSWTTTSFSHNADVTTRIVDPEIGLEKAIQIAGDLKVAIEAVYAWQCRTAASDDQVPPASANLRRKSTNQANIQKCISAGVKSLEWGECELRLRCRQLTAKERRRIGQMLSKWRQNVEERKRSGALCDQEDEAMDRLVLAGYLSPSYEYLVLRSPCASR